MPKIIILSGLKFSLTIRNRIRIKKPIMGKTNPICKKESDYGKPIAQKEFDYDKNLIAIKRIKIRLGRAVKIRRNKRI